MAHDETAPRWLQRSNWPLAIALVAAVAVAACVVTMMVGCYSRVVRPDSPEAIVMAFTWDMWPSVVACVLAGVAKRPAMREWVAVAAAVMAALWFYLMLEQAQRLSSDCMERLGWMLALGPILCAGILIAGALAGALAANLAQK